MERHEFAAGLALVPRRLSDDHSTLELEYEVPGALIQRSLIPYLVANPGAGGEGMYNVIGIPHEALDPWVEWVLGRLALDAETQLARDR